MPTRSPSTSDSPPGCHHQHNGGHWPHRDGGCTFPGCDRPPGWTQAHHVIHWIKDGPTDIDNLALLCHFHHHRIHEGGFGATRGPDGTMTFTRPDGTPITVPKGTHQTADR